MTVVRAEAPTVEHRKIEPGQVWVVDDQPGVRWLVVHPQRIIALFAGGADHTPKSLLHTYGERLRLEAVTPPL